MDLGSRVLWMIKMKRIVKTTIVFVLVILTIFAFMVWKNWYRPFSVSSEWGYEQVVIKNGNNYNANPDIIQLKDGCYRIYSHGNEEGVEENSIFSFHSCDGLNWEFEGRRIESAAMPAAMMLDDGNIRLYYQKGIERDGKPEQALMYADSSDGLNFKINEEYLLETNKGVLEGIKTIGHFEIIRIDEGYRIYFDEGELTPRDFERYEDENWNWPVWRIRSIFSEDGLDWKLDTGVRIDYEQEPLRYMQRAGSSTVIKQGDEYYMYFGAGFSPWEDLKSTKRWEWSGIYLATSKDGLNFEIIDKRLVKDGLSDPKILKIGDEARMYLSKSRTRDYNSIYTYIKK
ncbi:MAG: hypothetical protein KJ592_00980 [Nanoarchaeota archaeon]|nr:hypothetical protein [Nanoarchaeota archaeon]